MPPPCQLSYIGQQVEELSVNSWFPGVTQAGWAAEPAQSPRQPCQSGRLRITKQLWVVLDLPLYVAISLLFLTQPFSLRPEIQSPDETLNCTWVSMTQEVKTLLIYK